MRRIALPLAYAAVASLAACSAASPEDFGAGEQGLTCAANAEVASLDPASSGDALAAADGAPLPTDAPSFEPRILVMGVLEDTGCKSITIKDPRSPPKHPPLKVPLPKDWNTRCPAYGPPRDASFDLSKCTASSATLMECPLVVDKKNITFECRRDTPGGKGDAGGKDCNFHCYVKEGQ